MKYALYDNDTNSWLGNVSGPLKYERLILAKAAATILTERLQWKAGRLTVKVFPKVGALVYKDEITPPLSAEEAMKNIEGA